LIVCLDMKCVVTDLSIREYSYIRCTWRWPPYINWRICCA